VSALVELERKIQARSAVIGVVGLGYVGLPLALSFARAGFRVIGIDVAQAKVADVNAGRSYIADVDSAEVRAEVDAGRFRATSDYGELAEADCINVCVPTPLTKTKDPDVSFIVSAVEALCQTLRPGQLIVLGSTTYPGTTHELYRPLLERSELQIGEDFSLAFAPERIDPANKTFAISQVPKVVGGETARCTELAARMFEAVFDKVVPVSSSEAAEMVKLLENTFRMINVGLANEIAMICDRLDLDVWEVIEAAATKPYGFMKFVPGPGLGGHCIPVDPNYLAWKLRTLNFNARFIELASDVNQAMPGWVVDRIARSLNRDRLAVNGSRILLLGVAYKADVADARESPALDILVDLEALGAEVNYHDAWVPELRSEERSYRSIELSDETLRSQDMVVITTDHSRVDYARVCELAKRVFDTRNATRPLGPLDHVERL